VPIFLVPGFSQPGSVWNELVRALPGADAVAAVEIPDGLDFGATAAALAADVRDRATWVGYSLGGRLALQLALDRPEVVDALVLVSATAGIADDSARAARRVRDEADATTIERDGAAAFLTAWVDQPLFRSVPPERRALDARVAAMSAPRLAHQMRALGQGAMAPRWDRLGELVMPVTVVVGHDDAKYAEIGRRMVAALPDAALVTLPGGHSLPLEAPVALAAVVARAHATAR
jgi:2-succinyl-6-hydroxy-2,4-cyclohexadiene-1-carboxylate synthase